MNAQESTGGSVDLKMDHDVETAATRYRTPRGRGSAQAGRNVEEGSPHDECGNVRVTGRDLRGSSTARSKALKERQPAERQRHRKDDARTSKMNPLRV